MTSDMRELRAAWDGCAASVLAYRCPAFASAKEEIDYNWLVNGQTPGEAPETAALRRFAASLGYPVQFEVMEEFGKTYGPCIACGDGSRCGRRQHISLREGMSEAAAFRVLVHETVHAMHNVAIPAPVRMAEKVLNPRAGIAEEMICEGTAALVCGHLRVRNEFSVFRLAQYMEDFKPEGRREILGLAGDLAVEHAGMILGGIAEHAAVTA